VLLPGVVLLLSAGALWFWASRAGLQRTYGPVPGAGSMPALDPDATYVGPWDQAGAKSPAEP
jgi:hypothetical protein